LLNTSVTGRLAHDTALSDKEDVAVGELLLELTDETRLNLVELLQKGDRDEDDDSLLAVTDFDLLMQSSG
jgi:hypothetical protein